MNITRISGRPSAYASTAPWCRRVLALAGVLIASSIAITPAAHGSTWTNGGGDGLWSNSLNWNGAANSVYRYFTDTAVGASTANANRSAWTFYVTNSTGTHSVNITTGTIALTYGMEIGNSGTGAIQFSNGGFYVATGTASPLRLGRAQSTGANGTLIGTSSLVANMGFTGLSTVGYADSTFNAAAMLDMADSDNGSLTFASIRAGYANSTGVASSSMSFGDNWAFNIGTSGARGEMSLGYAAGAGTGSSSFTAGTGGSFTAYTSTLNIAAGSTTTSKSSVVNLSGINNGLINHVGSGADSFHIGRGTGSGTLQLGSNWTLSATTSHLVGIGTDGGTGSVTGSNLTFSGTMSFLYIGAVNSTGAGGFGTLDMGGGSFGTGLTAATVRVGVGGSSTGTAKLGSGTFALTGSIDIGDSGASGVEGLVELNDTMFTAGASAVVTVANSGRLNILVSDTSSGLILNRANAGALSIADTVANGNGILATFLNNPTDYNYLGSSTSYDSIYWAIKWAGDRTADLNTLITAGKISSNTSGLTGDLAGAAPQAIYDSVANTTYYGIYVSAVPEPGSLALAAGGLAIAGWSLRRRRGRAA